MSSVGGNPRDLKIGIVNREIGYENCANINKPFAKLEDDYCHLNKLPCVFLSELNDDVAEKIFYENFEDALVDAKRGEIGTIIRFNENFTKSFETSYLEDENAIKYREIEIFMDKSNFVFTNFLTEKIYSAFKNFSMRVMGTCGHNKKYGLLAMTFEKPIYGAFDSDFRATMFFPWIMVVLFYVASTSSALAFTEERTSGFWNRTLLTGIDIFEFLLSHVIIQLAILAIHILQAVVMTHILLPFHEIQEIFFVALIFSLLHLAGVFFGMAIACLLNTMFKVQFVLTGLVQVIVFICGKFNKRF
jgi:hypothetical protein